MLGLTLAPGVPATAATGAKAAANTVIPELVDPGQPQIEPRTEEILGAGSQGFLHIQRDGGYAWTRYNGTGTVRIANDDIHFREQFSYGSGSDTALVSTPVAQYNPPWTLKDMVTGATSTLNSPALPSGARYAEQGTFGDSVLALILQLDSTTGSEYVSGMIIVRAADGGATTTLTVTGWPDGKVPAHWRLLSGDAASVMFGFFDAQSKYHLGLVDTHTGVMTTSPAVAAADPSVGTCIDSFKTGAVLGPDRLAYVANDCNVHVLSRSDLTAPEQVLTFGSPNQPTALGLVGNTLLTVHSPGPGDPNSPVPVQKELKAYPLDGSAPTTLLPYASPTMAQAPDGSVVVEGGSSSTDWQVLAGHPPMSSRTSSATTTDTV